MSHNKELFVKDIIENQQVADMFLVQSMRLAETKAGKPYLTIELMDKSGSISGRVWDNAQQLAEYCAPGSLVDIKAQSQTYNGTLQLKVVAIAAVCEKSLDLSMYMPSSQFDIEEMASELKRYLQSVDDKNIKALLVSFYNDRKLWDLFKMAPAAKKMHHAYLGGLLEHTLGMCRAADATCALYPTLDRSLLIAGVFLHDLGKVEEFSFRTPPFDYTDKGRLVGHMVICIDLLQKKIEQMVDFPDQTAMLLKHLVLSHHGRHDFGSPTVPMTREAFVLNFIDDLDAKMNYLDRLSEKVSDNDYQWTDYQRPLERFMYVTGRPAQPENIEPQQEVVASVSERAQTLVDRNQESVDNRQQSLF